MIRQQLDYALVEDTRPPMYKAMKYWGKKPHNIWREFIDCYCPEDGVVLDPFAGSGVAAFESLSLGRKVISLDINPMSKFFIDVTLAPFDEDKFSASAKAIIDSIKDDPIYRKHYIKKKNNEEYVVYNYIWKDGTVWKINTKKGDEQELFIPEQIDIQNISDMETMNIPYWYPTDPLPNTPSINAKFKRDIGGDDFSFLWTRRNIYLLAEIFDQILQQDEDVKIHLMYAFVHTAHLVSKMVVARQERGNRSYSGSWGRADYMIRNRRMEQNPLIVFERACFDKQGIVPAMQNAKERLPESSTKNIIGRGNAYKKNSDINYGIVDVADLTDFIPDKSIDFIITDPPYGGLVQYVDLSELWLVWLQNIDEGYTFTSDGEITVKRGVVNRDTYKRRLKNAFVNLFRVLKDDGYLVVTFHNKEMQEWNDFVNAVRGAGFKFDKVTHQYNKRSGESNVANPYGTAASDFYIRCVKKRDIDFTDDQSALENFILDKTIEVIGRRNEPTPYDFIVCGVLPELLQAGYLQEDDTNKEIEKILSRYVGTNAIFEIKKNTESKAGDIWWFNNPKDYISYPDIPLTERVNEAVLALLRRKLSVKLDDTIAELFKMYPNGLTPDPRKIKSVLEKYATPSAGKWKLKDTVNFDVTKHTEMIVKLCNICKNMGLESFVGRREQPEPINDTQQLRDIANHVDVDFLSGYNSNQSERLAMIDCLFTEGSEIRYIFEVENSTNFSSAIIRASNASKDIPKYMIIPEAREAELLNFIDPLFRESFKDNCWKYICYSDIDKIYRQKNLSKATIDSIAKDLEG